VIWYVAPHDKVNAYMRRIDHAYKRSARQLKDQEVEPEKDNLIDVTDVPDLMDALMIKGDGGDNANEHDLDADDVLLDPDGDIPLKLFKIEYNDIPRFATSEWLPPLYLTTEERQIVDKPGTILLLGRSGTGKTVCISNRIHQDRHNAEGDQTFSQIFIARSKWIW